MRNLWSLKTAEKGGKYTVARPYKGEVKRYAR
jgi:hypothetical protein